MTEYISHSPEDTGRIAAQIASKMHGNEVIALYGDLGAGKTTFVREFAAALGVQSGVHSPTFAIVNEYDGIYKIYHFDMYRVSDADDLYSTGFFDYLGHGLIIIEWSENIEDSLPDNAIKLSLSMGDGENDRIIKRMN